MKEELQKLGMTKSEAILFELLIKYGSISGSQLAKKSGIDRTTTYNLLSSLNTKGYVSYLIKDGLKKYQISNPSNLKKFAEETVQIAESIIKQINETKQKVNSDSSVEIYEGKNAPKVMYHHYISEKNQEFYTYGGYGKMFSKLDPEINEYIKEFKSNKNSLYSFIPKDYPNIEKLRMIPGKIKQTNSKSIPVGFTVSSNTVTFHIYEDESKVIMIKHPCVAKSIRELFELAWGNESSKEI